MVDDVINEVMRRLCKEDLSPEQLKTIEGVLVMTLNKYEITLKSTELTVINDDWQEPLEYYLARKQLSGKSDLTIQAYRYSLVRALATINKKVEEISESDILLYLAAYRKMRNASNAYLDTMRRNLNGFFKFLQNQGMINRNPCAGIEPIKVEKRVRKPYTDEELERIRRACKEPRDIAMVEFLYATGVRVSEMVKLNRNDVNINENEVIVFGKGKKERKVFLTPVSSMYLKEYLDSRTDDNPALFVVMRKPHRRINKRAIEDRLTAIGRIAGVKDVHPHRFRRTIATNLLRKGMPIEEVKELLGHESIDTTLIYASVAKDSLKEHHRKYMTA